MRPPNKCRVLLAEDADDDVVLFRYAMRKAGVEIDLTVLKSGEKVVDYISGNRVYADRSVFPLPSLIFLDGQLRFKPSTALLKWIRAHPATKEVPVVILTGNLDPNLAQQAKASGALECIPKPMTEAHWAKLQQMLKPQRRGSRSVVRWPFGV
jgi:CheY-like chemotaxis protein